MAPCSDFLRRNLVATILLTILNHLSPLSPVSPCRFVELSRNLRFEDTSATAPMRRLLLNLVSKQLNWLCTVLSLARSKGIHSLNTFAFARGPRTEVPFEVVSSVNQMSVSGPEIWMEQLAESTEAT